MSKYHECFELIKSDYFRYKGKHDSWMKILFFACHEHSFAYSFWLRLCSKNGWLYYVSRFMRRRLQNKYGLQIPPETKIGHGLYLGHGIGVVINPTATIGNNCNISHFVTIGTNKGKAATIGDNVYIGPSVCIVEDVHIGNNVTIGAGSVVVKDIPDNAVAAGSPAKILSYNNPGRYINNKSIINLTK